MRITVTSENGLIVVGDKVLTASTALRLADQLDADANETAADTERELLYDLARRIRQEVSA